MAKKLWCIKKFNKIVPGPTGTRFWLKKKTAKKARDQLQVDAVGELPDTPDDSKCWMYHISPGPDHWRAYYA